MNYLIYTTIADQKKANPKLKELRQGKDKASARVVEFWYGEIEADYNMVLVGKGCEKVAEAYRAAGIEVRDLFEEPKTVEDSNPISVSKPNIPETQELVKNQPTNEATTRRGRPKKGE